MRNFDRPSNSSKNMDSIEENEVTESKGDIFKDGDDHLRSDMEGIRVFDDLSPETANYIQQLQMELDTVKKVTFCCFQIRSSVADLIFIRFLLLES